MNWSEPNGKKVMSELDLALGMDCDSSDCGEGYNKWVHGVGSVTNRTDPLSL